MGDTSAPFIDLSAFEGAGAAPALDQPFVSAGAKPTPGPDPSGPIPITYSALSLFKNCRRAYELRYIHQLVSIETAPALNFGTLIHGCLELHHGGKELSDVLAHIDASVPNWTADPAAHRTRFVARAMMIGYANRYPVEPWRVVALERTFQGPIINPQTGAASKSFVLAAKVDGIVEVGAHQATPELPAGLYIQETKTARTLSGDYLERLWTDFQVTLYSQYIERELDKPVVGVIYNVLCKTGLQQSAGETEEEFEARRAELIAKSKTGKSSAKRRMPETDEEFEARLTEWYAQPGAFHREILFLDRALFIELQHELWELTKALLEARRRDMYYQNGDFCFRFHRCAYFPLCRSGNNPVTRENLYRIQPPNSELGDPAEEPELAF